MPPPNRLAPDPYNSLYYSVPTPAALEPQYVPPMPLRQQLENVSAGLGRGVTSQLQDVQALLSDPRAYATNTLRGLRELVRNPALVGNVLRDTARRATSGPLGLGEVAGEMLPLGVRSRTPVRRDIDVYHGSPHEFERFDPSKIGTGEGAQAYGHGLYFAEAPDVAKGYAKTLANRDMTNQGRLNAHANAQRLASLAGDPKYAADDIRFVLANEPNHPQKTLLENTLYFLESGEFAKPLKTTGKLYTVDLPDKTVDKMLDWDAPLSQQPKDVQAAMQRFKSMYPEAAEYLGMDRHDLLAGPDLYKPLGGLYGDAQASKMLRAAGIPGIKYLDAGSRDAKKGTRNFVVFPGEEQQLRILKRE